MDDEFIIALLSAAGAASLSGLTGLFFGPWIALVVFGGSFILLFLFLLFVS